MKKITFVIETDYVNCDYEQTVEFDDDVTDEELDNYAEQFLWEHIGLNYYEAENEE